MDVFTIKSTRVTALGRLGNALIKHSVMAVFNAKATMAPDSGISGSTKTGIKTSVRGHQAADAGLLRIQALALGRIGSSDVMGAASLSLLACKYPLQVVHSYQAIVNILEYGLAPLDTHTRGGKISLDRLTNMNRETFKVKLIPQARTKVHVRAAEAARAYVRVAGFSNKAHNTLRYMHDLFDDQVAACFVYAASAYFILGERALDWAVRSVLDPEGSKCVTTALKSLGWNSTPMGAMLVEMNCLLGRGVKPCDWEREISSRVKVDPGMLAQVDLSALRSAVRKIYAEELRTEVLFPEMGVWWDHRWAWCVNGSHSSGLPRYEPKYAVTVPGLSRIHRRVFSENISANPVPDWNGKMYVSYSEKLEPGKCRAVFAGDSVTYFAFEHLVKPVEKAWRNYSVVLDPGHGGHAGMVDRIRKIARSSPLHVMLDYDDFNSQHSNEAQKIVIEELVAATGYDAVLGAKLVSSFDHVYICTPDGPKRVTGTMMSGHRCTSLINSVLNKAYLMALYPPLEHMSTVHVGDDVYVGARSFGEAEALLDSVSGKVRINPLKQSIGTESFEFLRVATRGSNSYGYLARAVATSVGGSWVTTTESRVKDKLTTFVSNAWTLANRSNNPRGGLALLESALKVCRLPTDLTTQLLLGAVGLGSGPSRGVLPARYTINPGVVGEDELVELGAALKTTVAHRATKSYLTNCTSEIERKGAQLVQKSLVDLMVESSYKKSFAESEQMHSSGHLVAGLVHATSLTTPVDLLLALRASDEAETGILSKYTLLVLLKPVLNGEQLRVLLDASGEEWYGDVHTAAWGDRNTGCHTVGVVSYSDASLAGSGLAGHNVVHTYCAYHV
jgi:hypothetical protein